MRMIVAVCVAALAVVAASCAGSKSTVQAKPMSMEAQALVQQLKSAEPGKRKEAAEALGALNDPAAAPAMIAALDDPEESVRTALADALGKMGPGIVPALTRAQKDPSIDVRWGALKALGQLQPAPVDDTPEALAEATRTLNAGRRPVLLKALDAKDWQIRWIAAQSLGKVKAPDTLEPLLRALRRESNPLVHDEIVTALGALGDPRTVPELIDLLRNADPNRQALFADALRRITGARISENTYDAWHAWEQQNRQ